MIPKKKEVDVAERVILSLSSMKVLNVLNFQVKEDNIFTFHLFIWLTVLWL